MKYLKDLLTIIAVSATVLVGSLWTGAFLAAILTYSYQSNCEAPPTQVDYAFPVRQIRCLLGGG